MLVARCSQLLTKRLDEVTQQVWDLRKPEAVEVTVSSHEQQRGSRVQDTETIKQQGQLIRNLVSLVEQLNQRVSELESDREVATRHPPRTGTEAASVELESQVRPACLLRVVGCLTLPALGWPEWWHFGGKRDPNEALKSNPGF